MLILAGSLRSGNQNLMDLWDETGFGIEVFFTTMSLKRFLFLLRCLRFDNIDDRPQRLETDKFAAFREVFEIFLANCERYYIVGEYTTIDEQLVPFRGRCGFLQYLASKPAKYGIKVFTLTDARTVYVKAMEVYVGRQADGPYQQSNKPHDIVLRLAKCIENTGRNITADNWYSSIPLAEELLTKRTTYVGTLRKNKRELPPEFVNTKNREERSTLAAFRPKMTLISYVPRKNKNVILLSTMHHDADIDPDTGDLRKPEIISTYNRTKSGVDTLDEMCGTYSTSRRCRRWPLVLFYRLLDISGINGQVVFISNNPQSKLMRRLYLREVGMSLVKPQIITRLSGTRLPIQLQGSARKIARMEEPNASERTDVTPGCARCTLPTEKGYEDQEFLC